MAGSCYQYYETQQFSGNPACTVAPLSGIVGLRDRWSMTMANVTLSPNVGRL